MMSDVLDDLAGHLAASLPKAMLRTERSHGQLTFWVTREGLEEAVRFLRDDPKCLFRVLIDICGADYPDRPERFEVVYHFLSMRHNTRIRVKVATDEATPVRSIVDLHSSAGWFEREAWDLFGIYFDGNPDLRRLLTDYGFEGHPLRKDFPLTGYVEVRYDEDQKRVVYEPVKLKQEFRSFDFLSPWEGMNELLPGDEKAAVAPTQVKPS